MEPFSGAWASFWRPSRTPPFLRPPGLDEEAPGWKRKGTPRPIQPQSINQSVNRVCQSINHQSISHRPPSIFASHPSHVSHRNNECLRKLYKYSHGAPLGRVSFRRAADRLTPVSSSPPPVTVTNSCGGSKWPSVLGGTLCEAKVQYCPNSTVRPRAASAHSRTKHALARPTRTPTSAWRPYSRITLCAAGLFSSDHWVSHCAIIIIVANPPSCVRPQPAALPPK